MAVQGGGALAFALLLVLVVSSTALAATGVLTQPSGTGGCLSQAGAGHCTSGHGLAGPNDVAVSPDNKNVYVAAYNNNGVAILSRNTSTGALSQPGGAGGCISETGAGPCVDGHALSGVISVAVSSDGKAVYAVTFSNALVRLDRNPATGALTQPAGAGGCISQTGAGPCADGHGLKYPTSVAVSPDGKSVYVSAAGADDVARFNRNPATNAISQPGGAAGCISDTGAGPCADGRALAGADGLTVSPDNKNVYVTSGTGGALVVLHRNTGNGAISQPAGTAGCISADGTGGECAVAPGPYGYSGVTDIAVSPGGTSVYLAGSTGVAHLGRNTTTGAVTQATGPPGCIVQDATKNFIPCTNAHGLNAPTALVVSPDGKNVYVGAAVSKGVAALVRNTATGVLSQSSGTAGCVNEDGRDKCANGHSLGSPVSIAATLDGKSVYLDTFSGNALARFNRTP